MKTIKLLDPKTASKIAAGEVIERPAGVLKELIENSLDAGADAINIDIESAGKKLIRVNDNGGGIAPEELPVAVLRHTTSKITVFEDLDKLNTFGFRGEALYSVSAISKLTISSCREGKAGRIIVEGGKASPVTDAPAIQGTTVEVRDLFFNTPARLKFLKSDSVERSHLLRCAEEAAMANPQTAFNIKTDNTKVYALPAQKEGQEGLRKRLAKILGEELVKDLLYIEDAQYGLNAFISPADKLCAARDNQFFFINKRPVNCKILQQALFKAYQPYRAKDKYPAAVIFLTLPPDEFDVNIHPQKRDIKFADESGVFNFIYRKLSACILEQGQSAQITLSAAAAPATPKAQTQDPQAEIPVPQPSSFSPEALSMLLNTEPAQNKNLFEARDFEEPKRYNVTPSQPEKIIYPQNTEAQEQEKKAGEPLWWTPPYNYLGQLHNSYLLFENPLGLVLVDQHAAQERIYFEEYMTMLEKGSIKVQPLMFPVSVEVSASSAESIIAWQDILQYAGFELSRFSARTVLVNTVPALLKFDENSLREFIAQLANVLGNPAKSDNELKYKLISTMACKKSIKAGEKLERTQADALMQNLKKCKDGLHCPHGRPTVITLETKEITKRFGRTSDI